MTSNTSFWKRIGLQDWFLKGESGVQSKKSPSITSNHVYKYLVDKFNESINDLSFAKRIVFYHEYIIAFNEDDYKQFMDNKKGIFGLIVQESLKAYYEILKKHRLEGKTVEPSSSRWVFRFVSNAEYKTGDLGFIGRLLPGSNQQEQNLRVTFIPRQTGIAQTSDISAEILKGFTFYSDGYYEAPYQEDLVYDEKKLTTSSAGLLARFEAILPDKTYLGKKLEYLMRDEEIVVSGEEDKREAGNIFRIPSDWVNTPHLRIRYSKPEEKFYVASFGDKTILNEKEITASTVANPKWVELPVNSKMVLNGIVGINIFKS